MGKKLRYLKRIRTFYNPIDWLVSSDSDSESESDCATNDDHNTTMAATSDEVETLLKKYTPQKKLHVLEPLMFGGTINQNPREWLRKFEAYTTLNKTDDKEKIITFGSLLDRSARCWFENLSDDIKKSWDTLKQSFEETYFNSNTWVNSQRIENRKLLNGESCTNYVNDMIELAQLTGLQEAELCKAILRGLPDSIKFQVVAHCPKSLDETIQRILLSESMNNSRQQEAMCSLEDRVVSTKMDNFVNKLSSSLKEIERCMNTFQQSLDNSARTMNPQTVPRCGFCNKQNHTEADCYLKMNRQQSRNNQRYIGRPLRGGWRNQQIYPRRQNFYNGQQINPEQQTQLQHHGRPQRQYYAKPIGAMNYYGTSPIQSTDSKNGDGPRA